jgi:hypothetical protein
MFTLIALLASSTTPTTTSVPGVAAHLIPHLVRGRVLRLGHGDAQFLELRIQGQRVLDFQVVVRRNGRGEILFVRQPEQSLNIQTLGAWPIDAKSAWAIARREAPPVRYLNDAEARRNGSVAKAWKPSSGGLIPVWVVRQASPVPLWSLETLVDGRSGELLSTVNRVLHANQARVFDYDPGSERDMDATTEVTLDPAPGLRLRSEAIEINNCCVTERCREGAEPVRIDVNFGQINASLPICDEMTIAQADDQGDWLFEASQFNLSGINTFATPIRAEIDDPHAPHLDNFAEVQGYHHAHLFMQHLSDLGLADFTFDNQRDRSMPLRITVNYLMPSIPFGGQEEVGTLSAMGCMGPLTQQPLQVNCFYPFDNAAFVPSVGQGTGSVDLPIDRPYDSVLMFQGIRSKFVYAADVLYHELAHAVIGSTSRISGGYTDSYGAHLTPGALNEGFADYAALSLTENPVLGRYVGDPVNGAIRRLDTPKACASDLTGEVHDDGVPWASSLWAFRQELDEDERAGMDTAVFSAMTTMVGRNAGYDTAATAVVQEASLSLGEQRAAELSAYLSDQGMLGCERVVALNSAAGEVPEGPVLEALHLSSADSFGLRRGEFIPAPFQLKIHLPAGTRSAQLKWNSAAAGDAAIPGAGDGGDEGEILGVIKLREAIQFEYDSGAVSHNGQRVYDVASRGSSQRLPMLDLDLSCAETLYVSLGTTGAGKVLRELQLNVVIDEELAQECASIEAPIVPVVEPVPADGCGCNGGLAGNVLWLLSLLGLRRRLSLTNA